METIIAPPVNTNPGTPAPVDIIPPPAPPIPPPPMYTPAPAPPSFATGGQTQSVKGFFQGISFVEVGMIALATFTMLSIVYYYRQRITHLKEEKKIQSGVQKDVEEIKMNVMNALGSKYKKF